MKNAFAVAAMGLMLVLATIGTQAQTKTPDVKPPVSSASHATPPVQAPASPAPAKPVPADLTTAYNEWAALNQAVAKIKHEEGIDKLEAQLENKRLEVIDLAAKEHYSWNPTKATFEPDAPVTPPAPAPATPAPAASAPAKK